MNPDDKQKIVEAFEEAFASLRLEGIEPTELAKQEAERIARGEITFAQAIENAKKQYTK